MPVYLTVSKSDLDDEFVRQKEERKTMLLNAKIMLAVYALVSCIPVLLSLATRKNDQDTNFG